jgi:hypothetical protein
MEFSTAYLNQNYDTYYTNLSSALQKVLSGFQTEEFLSTQQTLLSNIQSLTALQMVDDVVASLSSIPLHPYQRLMWKYFDPDHQFKTIDEVEDPGKLSVFQCIEYLEQRGRACESMMFHNLTSNPDEQLPAMWCSLSANEALSANEIVYDIEKQKKYLEFFEMARRVPVNDITEQNAVEIGRKLIAEFIRVV